MKMQLQPTVYTDDGVAVRIGARIHDEEKGEIGTYVGARCDDDGDWRFGVEAPTGEVEWFWKGRLPFWRVVPDTSNGDGVEIVGGCPKCGSYTSMVNIHRDHWAFCNTHKTRWLVGSNLFSSWRDEDEEIWARNRKTLEDYREVDPVRPGADREALNEANHYAGTTVPRNNVLRFKPDGDEAA